MTFAPMMRRHVHVYVAKRCPAAFYDQPPLCGEQMTDDGGFVYVVWRPSGGIKIRLL